MAKDSGVEIQQPFSRKQYEIRHRNLEGAMRVKTPKFFLINFYLSIVALPEKAMATPLHTVGWKIPWTEEPGRLQSMGS